MSASSSLFFSRGVPKEWAGSASPSLPTESAAEKFAPVFASNPVEVSIAAARQGRDALPALRIPTDTQTHTLTETHSHTLLPTRDQLNPQENCVRAPERSSNPIDRLQQ